MTVLLLAMGLAHAQDPELVRCEALARQLEVGVSLDALLALLKTAPTLQDFSCVGDEHADSVEKVKVAQSPESRFEYATEAHQAFLAEQKTGKKKKAAREAAYRWFTLWEAYPDHESERVCASWTEAAAFTRSAVQPECG